MPSESPQKVLAVLDDLMFTVKINEAAKRAGLPVEFLKSEKDALDRAGAQTGSVTALMIIDLNCAQLDPLALIQKMKADDELKKISLLGYVSHVQGELKVQAQQAGCDTVMARSAFSLNLPQLLQRYQPKPAK